MIYWLYLTASVSQADRARGQNLRDRHVRMPASAGNAAAARNRLLFRAKWGIIRQRRRQTWLSRYEDDGK